MAIDREYLRQHYASLSDDALAALQRDDLVEAAQKVYDEERARRGLAVRPKAPVTAAPISRETPSATAEDSQEDGEEPPWVESAACPCSFSSPTRADGARTALEAAGIPCYVSAEETPPDPPPPGIQVEYRVLVPGGLNLKAISVLDTQIYNDEWETGLRAQLEDLSDDTLRELTPEVICAGLADRIERLQRVYREECARRGF